MKSLNRVMFMGHLAADVELRQTKNGTPVANFPIAINRSIKTENHEKKEIVDYHRIIVWGRLAEICNEYLAKGVAVYVEGRVINRSFLDKEGNKHFKTEVIAENINFLTWKKSKAGKEGVELEPINHEEQGEEIVA